MKNIKKAIKQLIEFDRPLSILYIGMIFMVLAGIIMAILPVPAEAAIPVIVSIGHAYGYNYCSQYEFRN